MLTKEEAKEVIQIEGECRAVTLQTDATSIIKLEGKETLNLIEKKLKSLGYPINYEKVKAMEWCPIGLRVLSLLAIKDTLEWNDDQIRALGYEAPKHSFIIKLFALTSIKAAVNQAPKYWSTQYSVGKMEVEFHGELRRASYIIKEFKAHPILCKFIEGYMERVSMLAMPEETGKMTETKCVFRGDPYHQFDYTW